MKYTKKYPIHPLPDKQFSGASIFAQGGQLPEDDKPKSKTYTNKAEYDKALQAYNDSLTLSTLSNKYFYQPESIKYTDEDVKKISNAYSRLNENLNNPTYPIKANKFYRWNESETIGIGTASGLFKAPIVKPTYAKQAKGTLEQEVKPTMAKGTMESEPKPITELMMPSGSYMQKDDFIKRYGEKPWMKATGQKFAFGGKVPPGDEEAEIVARYNKTVPGLKEQKLKQNLGTIYNTDDNTWLSNLYNGFEQLNTNQNGNRNHVAELFTYPFQAGTRLAGSLDGQYSYGDITDPMSYVNAGLDMLAVSPIGKPLSNASKQTVKALGTESGVLSNTYKINPWAFKPNENNWYRQVGKSAVDDAFKKGVVREAGEEVSPRMAKEFEEQLVRMQGHGIEAILSSRKPASPYFGKGELFYPMGRKPNLKSKNPAAKGSADYLIETSLPNESFQPAYVKGMGLGVPTEIGQTAILKPNPTLRNLENFKFYEKNWLQGYKEVPKPIVKNTTPIKSTELPKDLEPYLSKKVTPMTKEEEVFNSFLSSQRQAKNTMKRTKKYDSNGKEIFAFGGFKYPNGGSFYNESNINTSKPQVNNTVPSSYTDTFTGNNSSVPKTTKDGINFSKDGKALTGSLNTNSSGSFSGNYLGMATAAVGGIGTTVNNANAATNERDKNRAIERGTVDTTMDVVDIAFPIVEAVEGVAGGIGSIIDSTNGSTSYTDPNTGKTYTYKKGDSGTSAAGFKAAVDPRGNATNFIGDITGTTENYGQSNFGMAVADLFVPFLSEAFRNKQREKAANQAQLNNSLMAAKEVDSTARNFSAFGGYKNKFPYGGNMQSEVTGKSYLKDQVSDFTSNTFNKHETGGVMVDSSNEVEKGEIVYKDYVFSDRLKDAKGNSYAARAKKLISQIK